MHAVNGVNFTASPGETLGVVGESGCGKSTMARCITRLIEPTDGAITFEGRDITQTGIRDMRSLRRDIAMVFQDPYASLDPRQRVGSIIAEPLRIHGLADRGQARSRAHELLEVVGLRSEHFDRYPHEFSGGQRQRIGIARALATNPKLIVCDEPTSALDVSIQAQVLNLLKDLQQEFSLTYIFISHDLGVIRYIADRLLVMYLGRVVEQGTRDQVFTRPQHPYTAELLRAVPEPDPDRRGDDDRNEPAAPQKADEAPSEVITEGCPYSPRCFQMNPDRCLSEVPPLHEIDDQSAAACYFPLGRAPSGGAEANQQHHERPRSPQERGGAEPRSDERD